MSLLALLATGPGTPIDPPDPVEPTLAVVAERTGVSTENAHRNGGGTTTWRSLHGIKADCQMVRLRFTNSYAAAWTLSAAVEIDGEVVPVLFDGETSISLAAKSAIETDPVDVGTILSGDTLAVRMRVTGDVGVERPWARFTGFVAPEGITDGVDLTVPGSALGENGGSGFAMTPVSIIALTATPPTSVAFLGDSIGERGNDDNHKIRGFAARAFDAAGIAWSNLAHWGTSTATYIDSAGAPRNEWTAHYGTGWFEQYTAILSALGRNDFGSPDPTNQQRHDLAVGLWKRIELESGGKPLAVTTVTPASTSTDSWATLGNQTIAEDNPRRAAYNAWLRDGAPLDGTTFAAVATGGSGVRIGEEGHPVSALVDTAATVEDGGSSAPTGKWAVAIGDTSMDGVHPGPVRHQLMQAAVDDWVNTL